MTSVICKQERIAIAEQVYRKTHFEKDEVIELLAYLPSLSVKDKLDRARFQDFLHSRFGFTDDIMMDRVFRVFDRDNDSFISKPEFVIGLSTFLRGTMEEKIAFCFEVYDLNSDGYITREEMYHMLKSCLAERLFTEEDAEEGIKELIEICIKKMDFDHDSKLSFNDYKESVMQDTLLLEVLGQCLPNPKTVNEFFEEVKDCVSAMPQ